MKQDALPKESIAHNRSPSGKRAPAKSTARRISYIGKLLNRLARNQPPAETPPESAPQSLLSACHDLLAMPGEASTATLAAEVLEGVLNLSPEDRVTVFTGLVNDFLPDSSEVEHAIDQYLQDNNPQTVSDLSAAVTPPRQKLISQLNIAEGGTAQIVKMRAALLRDLNQHPELAPLNYDLSHLLRSWFNRGFLALEQITWQTSASILEKLIAYESVHQIRDWEDLQRRLADDRRCFAFFHPQLPDEPLIFVEIALVNGMTASIESILNPNADTALDDPPDTAVFYSINNCQRGLTGISFGNLLIKQVTEKLCAELPSLKCFTTLSPVPGFRKWLERQLPELGEDVRAAIADYSENESAEDSTYREILLPLCAHYLTRVRRVVQPRDPVARFHLRNGAQLERINWRGDSSKKGRKQSFGILVNYVYDPDKVASNHEGYVSQHLVARSDNVDKLADKALALLDNS